ncbi:DEAD/DEAH box helicase [Vreelandella sulfidaeris]
MGSVIRIARNARVAQLVDADQDVKTILQSMLSYAVAGSQYTEAGKSGAWDGTSTFFEWGTGRFPAGFTKPVVTELNKRGYNAQLIQKPLPAPLGPELPEIDPFGYTPEYDYQPRAVDTLVREGQGIMQIATGGGKSRVCNIAVSRIRRPTLFLTTRSVLMYQMKRAFEGALNYQIANGDKFWEGKSVGVIGDGEWNPRRAITVGMVQTLAARLKEPDRSKSKEEQVKQARIREQTLKYLSLVEFVIAEEAHEAGGDSYYRIMDHCKNAHYRMALTATPFMRDDQEANMRLLACTGPVLIRVTEKMLIDRGVLARPYFRYHAVNYAPDRAGLTEMKDAAISNTRLGRSTGWQRAYKLGIIYNQQRNNLIVQEVVRSVSLGLPVMLLVLQKNHGRLLQKRLESVGVRAKFVFGDSNKDERQKALDELRDGVIQVLIGSTIMDVGVDVPAVGCVILAGGGKAEVALRQRIGRGLRAKKNGPNVALVIDFIDNANFHLRTHSLERLAIVQNTPGFAENIIYGPSDFDLVGMGILAA